MPSTPSCSSFSGKSGKKSSKYLNDDSLNDDGDDLDVTIDDESNTSKSGQVTAVKRKRGRPSATPNNKDQQGGKNQQRPGGNQSGSAKLAFQMRTLIDCVLNYSDRLGRVLSEPFLQLPTRRELPDYYEIIKKPIDLKKIQQKMKDGKYATLGQLHSDVELMCKNTQEYNIEGSQIYEDSVTLWSVFSTAKQRLLEHEMQLAREAREKRAAEPENNESGEDEDGEGNDVDMDNDDEDDEDDGWYSRIFERKTIIFLKN